MGNKPMISIIVPVYNVIDELRRCFDSIVSQSYSNLDIILIDDGSTDGSAALCDELAQNDPRVRIFHKNNGGLSSARNLGLKEAAGEWLLFVDSDDLIESDACEGLLAVANTAKVDFVLGDAIHETPRGIEHMVHSSLEPRQIYTSKDCIIQLVKSHQFYAPAVLALYNVSFLRSHNLYFVEGLLHEDMEFQPRLYLSANSIGYSGNVFYHYIDRSTSIMNASNREKRISAMRFIYSNWKALFDTINDTELRNALYGHLAKCYLWSCRVLGNLSLSEDGLSWKFLFSVGLNNKEKIKALIFGAFPALWCKL